MKSKAQKVAVLLCGSGFKDGSEIRESVGVLWALSEAKVDYQCFAPNDWQRDVINCQTGQALPEEKRNMLVEAARISRGGVQAIDELNCADYDALIIPGGFGVAKSLCTFAFEGAKAAVRTDVKRVVREMADLKKPIGAVCIAPALVGLCFPDRGLELTLGAVGEASQELEKLGHRHFATGANECHVDRTNRIVSTPAYMIEDAPLYTIFVGIQKMVQELVRF